MKIPNEFGTFRGVRTDNNEVVYGNYLYNIEHNICSIEYNEIVNLSAIVIQPVYPESLAACTTICDKNGVPIYGSFEIDGKMTRGGDIVKGEGIYSSGEQISIKFEVKWVWDGFNLSQDFDYTEPSFEIIGSQYEMETKNE